MSNSYVRYLENFSIPPNVLRYSTAVMALIVIGGFFTICIGNAIYDPFNFMDHAYISTAAKNFANNLGFSVAFESPASGLKQFEPAITTGPTLVLPAACLIRIFGNEFWVTGVAAILINIVIFCFLYFFSLKIFGFVKANIFISLLTICFYLFSAPNHFYFWFSLMGEAAGASLFILGLIIFSFLRNNEKYLYASMFVFGLTIITKLIFLISIFPVFIYFANDLIENKKKTKILRLLFFSITMFILPYLLWESYKLFMLGLSDYVNLTFDMIATYKRIYENKEKLLFVEAYSKRNTLLLQKSGFNLNHILLSIFIATVSIYGPYLKKEYKKFAFLLIISVLMGLTWWVFLSKGFFRYAFPFVFSFFFLLCFLIVVLKNITFQIILFLLLGFNLMINISDFDPIINIINSKFTYSEKTRNLNEVVGFLKPQRKEKIFVSSFWGTYTEIEYALPGANNFAHYDQLDKNIDYKRILLVRNTVYVERFPDEKFNAFAKSFTDTVFHKSPYLVTKYSGPKE